MYTHILVPTDGSPLSGAAVEQSMALARDLNAKVTVLAVVEPIAIFPTEADPLNAMRTEYERQASEQAARHLADAELKAKALGVLCEVVQVKSDRPYQAIIDTAAQKHCDLIAMASHGRRGVAALVLGSETTKVLTHSKLPVLVYR